MSRTRRSIWTLLTGLANTVTLPLLGLIAMPFLLRWLGKVELGTFRVALDWFGFVSLLELGLGGALQAILARSIGQQDRSAVAHILGLAVRSYLLLTGLQIIAALVLGLAMPWLVACPPDLRSNLYLGCGLAILNLLWVPFSVFRPLAEADQRGYLVNALLLVQSVLIVGLSVLFAWMGWGVAGQFFALFLGGLPFTVGLVLDGWRRYPDFIRYLRPIPEQQEHGRQLWSLNGPTLVHNLCGRLSLLIDNIVIARILGPAQVAPFYLSQRLVNLAFTPVMMIGNATWAGLAELHFRGNQGRLVQRLIELTRLTAVGGVALVVPTALLTRNFVGLWVGDDLYAGDAVVGLAAVVCFIQPLLSLWGWLFSGTAQVRLLLNSLIVATTVNFTVSLLATWQFGLAGPLLGSVCGLAGVSLWWLPLLLRLHFGVPLRLLFLAILGPILLAIPFGLGLQSLVHYWPPTSWLSLAILFPSSVLIYLLLAWLFVFDKAERAAWLNHLRQIWPR